MDNKEVSITVTKYITSDRVALAWPKRIAWDDDVSLRRGKELYFLKYLHICQKNTSGFSFLAPLSICWFGSPQELQGPLLQNDVAQNSCSFFGNTNFKRKLLWECEKPSGRERAGTRELENSIAFIYSLAHNLIHIKYNRYFIFLTLYLESVFYLIERNHPANFR